MPGSVWRQAYRAMVTAMGTTTLALLFAVILFIAVASADAIVRASHDGRLTMASITRSFDDLAATAGLAVTITAILWFILYAVFFVRAAIKNTEIAATVFQTREELEFVRGRVRRLLLLLPRPSSEQQERISMALKMIGPGDVVLHHMTVDTSGAMHLTSLLEDVFKRGGWRVQLVSIPGNQGLQGVLMKKSPQHEPDERHRGVLVALENAGIRCEFITNGKTDDRVELYIGNL